MKLRLTSEQSLAITTRDASVALSAGAGCGKTFVLTERFLSYVDPAVLAGRKAAAIGQLVAITFTEAAAREMRSRIRQKCLQRMHEAQGDAAAAWWALARRLDAARIHTIHGFCRALLAEHAVEAGLDPSFRVLDESQAGLLRLRVIDDFLRRKLATGEEGVFRLVRNGRIESLREDLLELLSQASSPAFDRWLDRTPEELCAAWRHVAEAQVPAVHGRSIATCAASMRIAPILDRLRRTGGQLHAKCERIRFLFGELEAGRGTEEAIAALREEAYFRDVQAKSLWAGGHAELREPFKQALATLRGKCQAAPLASEMDLEAALPTAADGLGLLTLAAEARSEYARQKAERSVLDFDDLIGRAVGLLKAPQHEDVLRQAQESIFALLVDEFQDTDRQQLELVETLCGDGLAGGKLFFVGDRKQSIYRFRGAEPRVFQELAANLPQAGRLSLTKNFRSQPAVLDFINALFVHEFGPDYEPLKPARPQVSPMPAVEFLWTQPDGAGHPSPPAGKLKVEDVRRAEAASLARRLKELLDAEQPLVWDADAAAAGTPRARPLKPGDIAILFRALSDVHLYEAALRAEGLDYYLVGGHAFYAQQEIRDFLHLLRAVASEADEVALAGVLRSPIFALHDETLFWLAWSGSDVRKGPARTLNEGLQLPVPPRELHEDERRKVARAAETLRHLRDLKDRATITAVVSAAIDRSGYDAVLLAEFLGERKLANLYKLIEDARAADAAVNSLDAFVTQLSHFAAKLPKEPLAATTSESANVIRLMTIHHAKGLEFPLVVLPDLNRRAGGGRETVALHAELGPLVPARPTRPSESAPVVGLDLYKLLEMDEERQEALRVLYVACTRAADYLILSSGFDAAEEKVSGTDCAQHPQGRTGNRFLTPFPTSELLARVARNFDLASGRTLRDLPDEYDEPQVRVTVCPLEDAQRGAAAGPRSRLSEVLQKLRPGDGVARPLPAEVLPLSCDVAPREFSFSRLSGMLTEIEQASRDGDDDAEPLVRERDAADLADAARNEAIALGQLVHAALEALPLTGDVDVGALVGRYAQTVLPASCGEYRERVIERAEKLVERVAGSRRFRDLAAAPRVAREVEFLLPWPPVDSGGPVPREEPRYLIRGVIDCLYRDNGGAWHLLDYKTNRVPRGEAAAVATQYELQMQVYALAVEQSLGVTPRELMLWFLDADEECRVPWNESLRARCIERVSQAIERLLGAE